MPVEARDSLVRLFEALPAPYLVPLSMFLEPLAVGRRMAWVTSLLMLADGDVPKLQPKADQIGRSILEICQNGGDNPQLFRRYVRRVIESDRLDHDREVNQAAARDAVALASFQAGGDGSADDPRAAATRAAPQSFRAQRGKALIEAAELLSFLGGQRHPEYFNSLKPGAWEELGARRQTAINAVGGLTRVMAGRSEPRMRDDLADALSALPVDSGRTQPTLTSGAA